MSVSEELLDAFDAAWLSALQACSDALVPNQDDFCLADSDPDVDRHNDSMAEIDHEYSVRFARLKNAADQDVANKNGRDPVPGNLKTNESLPDLPGYRFESVIRRGGNVVYRATQLSTGRVVAVKTVIPGGPGSALNVQRLQNEARILGSLNHPNIVTVFSLEEHQHAGFLVMEFVDGEDLAERVQRTSVSHHDAANIVLTAAHAIQAAHVAGVLHRDIKPSNILLDKDGTVRVTDFGLSRQSDSEEQMVRLTATAEVLGTPGYIAPEQAAGHARELSEAADVYGLGATLYHVLTRRPPFVGDQMLDVLQQVRNSDPPAPRLLEPRIPVDLETICLKCLEKNPDHRFRSADLLADDLKRFLANKPIQARPTSRPTKILRWCQRNKMQTLLTAMVTILLLTSIGLMTERAITNARDLQQTTQQNTALAKALEQSRAANDEVYDSRIRQALLEYNANQLANVHRVLDLASLHSQDAPAWEWAWINSLLDASEWQVNIAEENAEWVGALEFSPDGSQLAVGNYQPLFDDRRRGTPARVQILDANSGERIADLGETLSVTDLVYTSDGETLFVAESDLGLDVKRNEFYGPARIRRWNTESWREEPVVAEGYPFEFIHISDDERKLITQEAPDGRLESLLVFDLETKSRPAVFKKWKVSATSLGFNAVDEAGNERTLPTRNVSRTATRSPKKPSIQLQGKRLAIATTIGDESSHQTSVIVRSKPANLVVRTIALDFVESVALSPDERRLAIATNRGEIQIWDTENWQELFRLRGHTDRIRCLAFSPGGKRLASGDWVGNVRVWELTHPPDFQDTLAPFRGKAVDAFYLSDDLQMKAIVIGQPLQIASLGNQIEANEIDFPVIEKLLAPATRASFIDDGAVFVVPSLNDRVIEFRSTATGQLIRQLPAQQSRVSVVRTFGEAIALAAWPSAPVADRHDTTAGLRLFDAKGTLRFSADEPGSRIYRIAMSKDAQHLSAAIVRFQPDGTRTSFVRTWHIESAELIDEFAMPSWVLALEYSQSNTLFAIDFDNGDLVVRNPSAGTTILDKQGFAPQIQDLEFSPDGLRLAGTTRSNVTLWNVATSRQLLQLTLRNFEADYIFNPRVQFSRDGKLLMATQADGTVRSWGTVAD